MDFLRHVRIAIRNSNPTGRLKYFFRISPRNHGKNSRREIRGTWRRESHYFRTFAPNGANGTDAPKPIENMTVRYHNDDCTYRLPEKRRTAEWLRGVAASEGYTLGELNYIFCSSLRLLEMNRQFLGHDYFTDIITFDYSDRKGTRIVSGDVFIDVETVADNARRYGATRLEEMRRVVVHGVLHLCGQGDKTPRTNAQMHRKEDKYLKFWEYRP